MTLDLLGPAPGLGMPGVKVLWRGFQRMEIFTAWIVAHPRRDVGKG